MSASAVPIALTPGQKTFIEIVATTVNEYRANRNDESSLSESVHLLMLGIVSLIENETRASDGFEGKFAGILAFGATGAAFSRMCEAAAQRLVAGAKP